jgi:hypothetical protein
MRYTFWHAGVLMGESDLAFPSAGPAQRTGIFVPTPYGLSLLPRITGMLAIGVSLRKHLASLGRSEDDMSSDELVELINGCDAGRALLDVGRVLSEITLRRRDGSDVNVASMSFSDVEDIKAFKNCRDGKDSKRGGKALGVHRVEQLEKTPHSRSRYIVSATFAPTGRRMVRMLTTAH